MSDREKKRRRQGLNKYEGECEHQDFWVIRHDENPTTINSKITRGRSYINRNSSLLHYPHITIHCNSTLYYMHMQIKDKDDTIFYKELYIYRKAGDTVGSIAAHRSSAHGSTLSLVFCLCGGSLVSSH